ncbi:1614_t:CDS:10 [Ambispora gerdemannii]|uniref:1614_t:CDS:1 n=1 Tax=Ambispora gerdemannii TaxID=144530 RepID=A0A9N9DSA7_9GLOM|nr:1614_t:CDS:10 [Ambispora gerdemannii]
MSVTVLQNFIDGEFVNSVNTGQYIDSHNPATGKVHVKIPDSTKADVNNAVEAAQAAFKTWSKLPRTRRSNFLYRIADILESRLKEFAEAEVRDQGKTITFATNVDINRSVYNFRYFAGHVLHAEEKVGQLDGVAMSYVQRWPVGVAGLISPWNLPLYLLTWKIAPCIASGNTCVCKPSEFTSLTAYMLCSVFKEAGLPNGVVNMVFGSGQSAGEALVTHPNVPLISFTGGTVTGKHIMASSVKHMKKLSLELGGKNANIIFDDCNFEQAVETSIRSSFWNQGEICLCGSRIFVQETIYQKFLDAFIPKARDLVVGDPNDSKTFVGALNNLKHMEKVLMYIDLARQEGGVIECGGSRKILQGELSEGYFVEPTVITGLPPTSRVAQEEIFGPVVTVHPFTDEQQAIDYANDSPYGLSCSVWSENDRRARRVSESIQVGTVWVNCWLIRDLRMPFGGTKASGLGREGADYSMDFFTELKTICLANF